MLFYIDEIHLKKLNNILKILTTRIKYPTK